MSQRRSAATTPGGSARPAALSPHHALPALHSASGTAATSSARAAVSAAHDDASPPLPATHDLLQTPGPALGSPQPRSSSNKPSFRDSKEQPQQQPSPSPPVHASQGGSNARISSHKLLDLESEILSHKSALQRKDEYISGLQRNCETLAALCAKHIQQVSLLKSDLDRVSVEKFVLEHESKSFQSNAALTEKLSKDNEELQHSVHKLRAHTDALQSKVYITQNQISDLTEQKDELLTDLAREKALYTNCKLEVDELRQIVMTDHHSSGATRRTGAAAGAAGKTNHAEIEHRISSLKHEYEANKLALEELQSAHKALQLAHTKAGNMAARVAQECDSLGQDNARLKKGLAQLRKEHAETREVAQMHANQNEQLRAAYDALAAEHAYATQRLPEVEAALRSSEKQRASLKKQHDEAWSTKEDLALQLAELRADGEIKDKQTAALANQPSKLEIAQAGEAALLQAERVSLVQQLSAAQQRLRELEVQLADSDNSLLRWQGKYDAAVREKAELTRQLHEADAQSRQAQDSLRQAAQGQQGGRDAMAAQLAAQQAAFATAAAASASELAAAKKLADSAAASIAAADAAAAAARADLAAQTQKHQTELAELKAKADAFVASRLAESDRAASKQQAALMSAQHRTAELEALLDHPRLSASDLSKLAAREKELQAAVAKLVVNEEASEASFTCFACVGVFNKPVTCIPCGHSYCIACIRETNMCTQCKPPTKVTYYANELLEELASRFIFRKQALQTLKSMTQQAPGSLR